MTHGPLQRVAASLITTLREAVPSNSHAVPTIVRGKRQDKRRGTWLRVMAGEGAGKGGEVQVDLPGFPEPALAASLSDTERVISLSTVSFPEK